MTNPKERYKKALADFAIPGNRWSGVLPLTYWAALADMNTEEVIYDAHGVGVHDRDVDIRRGMASAQTKVAVNTLPHSSERIARPEHGRPHTNPPIPAPERVRQLIDAGIDVNTFDALRRLSPTPICSDSDTLAWRVQCELHLLALFGLRDMLHVFNPDVPSVGTPGKNIKSLSDWLYGPSDAHPDRLGEIVRPNPLTGLAGTTKDGKESYIAQSCIKEHRHMVFEFDSMPLEEQCRFWGGFVRTSALPLVSLVYSGNKSIHGVVRVNAPDADTWKRYRERILRLFASDADSRHRLDPQALHPLTGTRLAGVTRSSTGKRQELLWICADWFDTAFQAKLNGAATRPLP